MSNKKELPPIPDPDAERQEEKARATAKRRQVMTLANQSAELPDKDEFGNPYVQKKYKKPPILCGNIDGHPKYPLWTGGVVKDVNGVTKPRIVMVPCSDAYNNGQLVATFKRQKGFREVSEIPDAYAEFRDPYLDAIEEMRVKLEKKAILKEQLESAGFKTNSRAGLTTTDTMRGLVSGNG